LDETLATVIAEFFDQLLTRQAGLGCPVKRLVLAYSGGLDSAVLFHLLQHYVRNAQQTAAEKVTGLSLVALHVNHGLQTQASQWAQHCVAQAVSYGIKMQLIETVVQKEAGQSLEDAAREARYQIFQAFVKEGDVLCLAHHQNDQAETLLFRLLRGSGPLGLAAMRDQLDFGPAILVRPLLRCSRNELENYARMQGLNWVDDPSNEEVHFDRNYLRHEILPRLQQRWPAVIKTFARVAEINQDTVQLLTEVAQEDYKIAGRNQGQQLCVLVLRNFSEQRIDNLLRYWLQKQGSQLPSRRNLLRIRLELLRPGAGGEARVTWADTDVRVYQHALYCLPKMPEHDIALAQTWVLTQSPEGLFLGEGRGTLRCKKVMGQGIQAQFMEQASQRGDLHIRWRQGGERCHPAGRQHSQSLKKLLQEYHVPPWLRQHLPLIYSGEHCLAVPGLWVCKDFAAAADAPGYVVNWTPRSPTDFVSITSPEDV
jgi:tRNA(Ile)-lysidine synthase